MLAEEQAVLSLSFSFEACEPVYQVLDLQNNIYVASDFF